MLLEVPKDVISMREQDDDIDSVREIYAKVKFSSKNVLHIMNDKTQRRIQWIFDPDKGEFRMQTCYQRYACEYDEYWDRKHHLLIDKGPLAKSEVLKRLMRTNTNYRNRMDKYMLLMQEKVVIYRRMQQS